MDSMAQRTSQPVIGGVLSVIACMALLGSAVAPSRAQTPSCAAAGKPRLNVTVENVRSNRGELIIELYANDPDGFLSAEGRVERVHWKAQSPVTKACILAPEPGPFAVVIYHDENSDGRFNRSMLGIPTEGFGFSNNVRVLLGPPSLSSVLIDVPRGETSLEVRLRYMGGGGRG